MNKRTDRESNQKITVDISTLQAMLSVGRNTAAEIGKAAGAELKVGRRCLYLVSKIESYMENLTA